MLFARVQTKQGPMFARLDASSALSRGVRVACIVKGAVNQDGNTCDMVFSMAKLVSYMSHTMTLEPGDGLLTGTPEGVGPLVKGDCGEMIVEGVPPLSFSIDA
jgi:2-keto-4-pentenoate hydratase/2-oxohepta-3-ene-1,7-dioic acid hydratase in catechol pathway